MFYFRAESFGKKPYHGLQYIIHCTELAKSPESSGSSVTVGATEYACQNFLISSFWAFYLDSCWDVLICSANLPRYSIKISTENLKELSGWKHICCQPLLPHTIPPSCQIRQLHFCPLLMPLSLQAF